jgi:hypothetical protein
MDDFLLNDIPSQRSFNPANPNSDIFPIEPSPFANSDPLPKFAVPAADRGQTVNVVQLVRTPDCDSGGRGFESRLSPRTILD